MSVTSWMWDGLSKIACAADLPSKSKTNLNAVINYHSIGEPGKYGNVSESRLKSDLIKLSNNYNIVDLVSGNIKSFDGEMNIAITFDDGFYNFYTNAYPIINDLEIPVTIFITAGFLGDKNIDKIKDIHNISSNGKIMMDKTQIQEISTNNLINIGNHTWAHPKLGTINDEGRLKHEIIESKIHIEDLIGEDVELFSYPHGSFNEESVKIVRDSHMMGFSSEQALIDEKTSLQKIPRLNGHKKQEKLLFELSAIGQNIRNVFSS